MVGGFTILLLKFSPMNMNEIKEWQNAALKERELYVNNKINMSDKTFQLYICICYRKFIQEQKQSIAFQYDETPEMKEHEKRLKNSKNDSNNAA